MGPVRFDGVDADREAISDLLAGVALRHQPQDLSLPCRQLLAGSGGTGSLRPLQVAVYQDLSEGGVNEGLTALDGPDGRHQLRVGGLLHEEPGRPDLEELAQVRLVAVHGEDEESYLRGLAPNLAGRLQPAEARQRDVEENDVGADGHRLLDRLPPVTGLIPHLHVILAVDEEAKTGPPYGVAICHEDSWRV